MSLTDSLSPSTLRRFVWRFANRFDGAHLRYRYLREARRVARLDEAALEALQLEALRKTLAFAGATVPYWRDVFRQRRFDPSRITSVEALSALPITDKALIRAQGDRMRSDAFDKRRLIERSTGGSTGEPLRFCVDRPSLERQMAINLLSFEMAGLPDGEKILKIWGYRSPLALQNLWAPLSGRAFESAFDTGERALQRFVHRVRQFRPRGIYGYAGAVAHFARYVLAMNIDIPKVEVVMTTAEKLFPEMRRDIADAFRGHVIDTYGAHECVRLATECRFGTLHRHPDAAILEFGHAPRSPEARPILLTSLTAAAMPFIRYDLGDRGAPAPSTCPCGSPFPAMTLTAGKVHRIFHLPDRTIHSSELHGALYRTKGIARFQIHHVETGRIDLRIVPLDTAKSHPASVNRTLGALRRAVGERTEIRVFMVDTLQTTIRGKHQAILSSVPEDE